MVVFTFGGFYGALVRLASLGTPNACFFRKVGDCLIDTAVLFYPLLVCDFFGEIPIKCAGMKQLSVW